MAMEIVTCPSTDDFKAFRGGMVAVRAAAFMGPARGTLTEVVSADAMSGSYVQDEQTVSWGGTDHFEDNYDEADDTLVIDPADLPLEAGLWYYPFITLRLEGTAGVDDGRLHESFWRYDAEVFKAYVSNDDFVSNILGASWMPRGQMPQFSLVWCTGGTQLLSQDLGPWRFRLFKRDVSGGDVALQIEQVIFVPDLPFGSDVGAYDRFDFQFSSTFGSKPSEAAAEASLESGIYTLDADQPRGNHFFDVRDLQDSDGSDPEASVLDVEPAFTDKSVYHIGGGIVFAPDQEVEVDEFSRTYTGSVWGSGDDFDNWAETPYGYHWKGWNRITAFYDGFTVASVDGSVAYIGPVYTPGYYAPLLLNGTGQRSVGQFIGGARQLTSPTRTLGPTLTDARDWRVRAKVAVDNLPTDVVEGSEGNGYPAPSEDGLINLDVGQFSYAGSSFAVSVAARLVIVPDGSISLVLAQHYWADSAYYGDVEYGTPVDLGTYTPNDWIWVEYARQGYNVYAKAWFDGDSEPADYQLVERVQVPYSGSLWDPYTYDTEQREDRSWGRNSLTLGTPGVAVYAQTHYNTAVTLACDEFRAYFHADWLDGEFDPTDVFLRVDEQGDGTIGPTLNMGSKSQNWVMVADRAWPALLDIYQWNDEGSQPLQWMITGMTYSRRYLGGVFSLSHLRVAHRYGDRVTVRPG